MDEQYPHSALITIRNNFKLSESEESALTKILTLNGMQTTIQQGTIEVTALLTLSQGEIATHTILPEYAAKELIILFKETGTIPVIASKQIKISEFIFWFTFKGVTHVYIPVLRVAELILESPSKKAEIQTYIQEHAEGMERWVSIKKDVLNLNNILPGQADTRCRHGQELNLKILQSTKMMLPLLRQPLFEEEYLSVIGYLSQQINASIEQLENTAKEYFIDYFKNTRKLIEYPDKDITFLLKKEGKQLGRIIKIKYRDLADNHQKEIQYFIKTNEGGSTQRSGSTQPVDYKEIFIFKVLELIGLGPKILFYFNQSSNTCFYIATQDAGFTNCPSKKHKFFATYKDLINISEHKETDSIDNNTKKGILSIDIISRIFVLRDVITNSSNFGRVAVDNTTQKWKIVDFNRREIATPDWYIVDGFKAGHGAYDYPGCIGKVVRESNLDEKMALSAQIIDELEKGKPHQNGIGKKLAFADALNEAFIYVFKYIKKHSKELKIDLLSALGLLIDVEENDLIAKLSILPENKVGKFAKYMLFVKQNFALLAQGIRAYQPDNPSQSSVQCSALKPP